MLVLNNSGIRNFILCVVYNRITLIVLYSLQYLCLEVQGTVLKFTIAVIIILVDHTCVYDLVCLLHESFSVFEEILFQFYFHSVQHALDHLSISLYRDTLVIIVKIVVVISKTYRKTFDDKGWKLCGTFAPLFLCITFYQLCIYVRSDQADCLLFQVLRILYMVSSFLLFNLCLCFLRSYHTPEFVECVHVKRHIVNLTFVVRYR